MAKIKDIEGLRDFALLTLEKLTNQEIDVAEAGVTGKLCEGVISTIKVQLEYARAIGKEPNLPFLGNNYIKSIEGEVIKNKSLPSPSKK